MKGGAGVKNGLRAALYHTGVLGAWHRWRNRHALTVLMFHRVLPADDPAFPLAEREFTFTLDGFRHTLDFVQRHYSVLSLDALQSACRARARLPRNPLLITFDDGWRDTLDHAWPELVRRRLPAVLFVASELPLLQSARWWQDALVAALAQPGGAERLCRAAGGLVPPASGAGPALAAYLGAMPESERLAWLEAHAPGVLAQVGARQMLTWGELQQLQAHGLAIGGHGHTHSPLTLCFRPQAELRASRGLLEQLQQGVRSMSFPHGAESARLAAQAQALGFEWIFGSHARLNDVARWGEPLPVLGRIHVPENELTCTQGHIDPARLATFLFFRPQSVVHRGAN